MIDLVAALQSSANNYQPQVQAHTDSEQCGVVCSLNQLYEKLVHF